MKTKTIEARFRRDITCKEIDVSINKLLENFDPEQEVEVSFDDDYKNIVVYIDTIHKPYLRVVK